MVAETSILLRSVCRGKQGLSMPEVLVSVRKSLNAFGTRLVLCPKRGNFAQDEGHPVLDFSSLGTENAFFLGRLGLVVSFLAAARIRHTFWLRTPVRPV